MFTEWTKDIHFNVQCSLGTCVQVPLYLFQGKNYHLFFGGYFSRATFQACLHENNTLKFGLPIELNANLQGLFC